MLTRGLGTGMVAAIVALMAACSSGGQAPPPVATAVKAGPSLEEKSTPSAAKPDAKLSALEQMLEGARREGVVRVNISSQLGEKGAQRLAQAFNKRYDLNVKLEYTPATKMEGVISQVVTELRTGGVPSWDVINGIPRHFVEMVQAGLLTKYDWAAAFPHIPPEASFYDGAFVAYSGEHYLPAYHGNLVKQEDVPRTWEDTVGSRWKGKLVAHNSSANWVRLTEGLGEPRVTALVEAMVRQDPVFVNLPQVIPRVSSGEFSLAPYAQRSAVFGEQAKGAPIRLAEGVNPVIGDLFGVVVPQKVQHPNAARLFTGFLLTPEAQNVWWEEAQYAAPFIPGPLTEWLKGKEVVYASVDFLQKDGSRLDEKYLKIMGLK